MPAPDNHLNRKDSPVTAGKIVWREYIAADRDKAIAFYTALLGWNIQAHAMEGQSGTYPMIHAGKQPIGGFDLTDWSDDPPHWLVYIRVPDSVEAAVARAVADGGAIVRPAADLPGIGRRAILRDPNDALFCPFDPLPPADLAVDDAQWPPAPGSISWYGIAGYDLAATAAFYSSVFGYDPAPPDEVFSPANTPVLTVGDKMYAGVLLGSDALPPQWLIYVVVTDIAATALQVGDLGGSLITPIMTIPGVGKILGIKDPLGASFFVHQPDTAD
jgi:predicted enzyme related to lactoylglutathione lyase